MVMNRDPLDALKRGPRTSKTHKRFRDAGAIHEGHLNTDLVQFEKAKDGTELWTWVNENRDPLLNGRGRPWHEVIVPAEGELVLVYDPSCRKCLDEVDGCHYCHPPYDTAPCPICGRGLFMTDRRGWSGTRAVKQYYSNPEDADVDLDFVPLNELAEYGELPYAVAKALIEYQKQLTPSEEEYRHDVATFLDTLADLGYGVTKIEVSNFGTLLPAPEGNQR